MKTFVLRDRAPTSGLRSSSSGWPMSCSKKKNGKEYKKIRAATRRALPTRSIATRTFMRDGTYTTWVRASRTVESATYKDEISPAKYVRSEVEGTTQGEMFFRLKAANYACSGLSLPETCPKRRGKKRASLSLIGEASPWRVALQSRFTTASRLTGICTTTQPNQLIATRPTPPWGAIYRTCLLPGRGFRYKSCR